MIANLAVFIAWHLFWPSGWQANGGWATLDAMALAVAVAAGVALIWRGAHVIPVILASGATGLLLTLVR